MAAIFTKNRVTWVSSDCQWAPEPKNPKRMYLIRLVVSLTPLQVCDMCVSAAYRYIITYMERKTKWKVSVLCSECTIIIIIIISYFAPTLTLHCFVDVFVFVSLFIFSYILCTSFLLLFLLICSLSVHQLGPALKAHTSWWTDGGLGRWVG